MRKKKYPLKTQVKRGQNQKMKKKSRDALEHFVQKAQKLERFGLDKHIIETGLGFHVRRNEEDDTSVVEFDLPNEEKRDATLLTLRLFTQHNESFSFPQLSNIAQDMGLTENFRNFLLDSRKAYYDFLNDYPIMIEAGFFEENFHPTRMDVFNVVLNGTLAHTRDAKKRQRYIHWSRDGIRENVLLQAFSRIVQALLRLIYFMSEKCVQELENKTDNSN